VVETPVRAVGQHAHVSGGEALSLGENVAGELLLSFTQHPRRPQVLLNLDNAVTDLDIEAPPGAIPDLYLKPGNLARVQR
jgi:hypothetical protein